MSNTINTFVIFLFYNQILVFHCFPEQGKWSFTVDNKREQFFGIAKSLYKDSYISIKVVCTSQQDDPIYIGWVVRQTACYDEYVGAQIFTPEYLRIYYNCPEASTLLRPQVRYLRVKEKREACSHSFHIMPSDNNFTVVAQDGKTVVSSCAPHRAEEFSNQLDVSDDKSAAEIDLPHDKEAVTPDKALQTSKRIKRSALPQEEKKPEQSSQSETDATSKSSSKSEDIEVNKNNEKQSAKEKSTIVTTQVVTPNSSITASRERFDHQAKVDRDGMYLLVIYVRSADGGLFNMTVDIEMKSHYGYLSAVDWPLLPFYGVMCGVYAIYALAWLIVTALQWRDLLRIQFWIGGVIFLGLVEKAVLYAEFQSLNESGETAKSAIIFAELLSSFKRTLARMLVIIVSLGFGIVKPRLGPLLHRVVGVGALYFILSAIEGCLRSLKVKNDPSNQTLIAGVPLAVMDSAICWWIFSSLVQTTRTLQLRRNLVKLTLYKHFTNTLIFAVFASIAYMIWSIRSHKFTTCITDWKELWVDDAYWHFLFSIILLVIMILWRPTNNNQRYAFTPLLDAEDDYDEDEIKDHALNNDAFGMKMRGGGKNQNNTPVQKHKEDDIKWVEENIPSLSEPALPSLLDSDEEIMTAKFERNKME